MAKILTIDYETRSPVDLKSCGAYVYAENPLTDVIFLAVKEDDQVARVWVAPKFRHLVDNEIPDEELLRLIDEAEELVAHNSFFEEVITKFKMPFELELSKVRDTMAQVQMCGFPANLETAAKLISGGKVLKDEDGAALMKKLSSPRKFVNDDCVPIMQDLIDCGLLTQEELDDCKNRVPPSKSKKPLSEKQQEANYKRKLLTKQCSVIKKKQTDFLERLSLGKAEYTEDEVKYFLKYDEDPNKYKRFLEYARQDVEVEYYLFNKLPKLSEDEQRVWELSETINLRGVRVDVENIMKIEETINNIHEEACERGLEIAGGNVTSMKSNPSIKKWLSEEGIDTDSIDKEAVKFLLSLDLKPEIREFLEIRKNAGKTSTGKYAAMRKRRANDERLYGQFIYHGATTGRFASKGVQLQNLARPVGRPNVVDEEFYPKEFEGHIEESDVRLLASGDVELVKLFWKDPTILASDLVRSMFIPKEGYEFLCADFSAVEGRGIAWLAKQEDKLQAFRDGKDLYKVAASGVYKIPYEEVDGGGKGPQRQVGKTCELALGFGGGWSAMLRFHADKLGLSEEEGKEIIKAWRRANDKIVELWYALRDASLDAMRFPGERIHVDKISFRKQGSFLTMKLPSGRNLYYPFAKIEDCEMPWEDKNGNIATQRLVTTMTLTEKKAWVRKPLSHITLSENATQAMCRDLLINGIRNLEAAGYPIVLHIHDEAVSEIPKGYGDLKEYETLMAKIPAWAEGFPLCAVGWRGMRYCKD